MDWYVVLLMMEGHQPIEQLERLPVSRLVELGEAVQACVREKNRLVSGKNDPEEL